MIHKILNIEHSLVLALFVYFNISTLGMDHYFCEEGVGEFSQKNLCNANADEKCYYSSYWPPKKIMHDVKVKNNPVPQEIAQPDSPLPRKKLMIRPLPKVLLN